MDKRSSIKREAQQVGQNEDSTRRTNGNIGEMQKTGPDIIQFSPCDQKHQEHTSATEGGSGGNDEGDDLLESAIEELRHAVPRLEHSAKEREEALRVYLARAYKLSMAGLNDPSRHEALLLRTKIKKRADTPHHKQTLRAIQTLVGSAFVKGSEHEWSLVLAGMEEAKVPDTENDVIRFLTEPEDVGGQVVRGFDRPKAVLKASKALKDRRKDRLQEKKNEREDAVAAFIERAREEPLGSIEPARDGIVGNKIWISVNEGEKILLDLQLTNADLQKLIYMRKSKGEEGSQASR